MSLHISAIDLFHIAIPLLHPFETSFGVIDRRPALIFRITCSNGAVGIGESSPLYTPLSESETLASGLEMLKRRIPACIGAAVNTDFDILSLLEAGFSVTSIGLEGAYIDTLARSQNISFSELLGATNTSVLAGESIGLQPSIEETVAEAEKYVAAGYTRIKVKIAPGRDLEIVRAVRERFPTLELGADANAAYGEQDIEHLSALKEYSLAFVEQPFGSKDLSSHARLRKQGLRICLDESVIDNTSLALAIETGACDIVNIKPARIGSYIRSKRIHDVCVSHGIGLFGGGRLETGIGKTANAALYALPGFTLASDITPPSQYFSSDVIQSPFSIQNGSYTLPAGKGLGIEVDEDVLSAHTIEHVHFE